MQFVIIALLIVAALLGLLTVWYWKQTDPSKSNSTISGSARYDNAGFDDYYAEDDYDDGYRAHPQVYANDEGPTHLPGDVYQGDDRRRPVVRQGPGRQAAAAEPSADDAWAAMTGAQNNEPERY